MASLSYGRFNAELAVRGHDRAFPVSCLFRRTMHEESELTGFTSCDRGAIVIVFLLGKFSRIEEPSASTLQSMSYYYRMTACGCFYPGVWFS